MWGPGLYPAQGWKPDRALSLQKLICIFFFSGSFHFGPVLGWTNHQTVSSLFLLTGYCLVKIFELKPSFMPSTLSNKPATITCSETEWSFSHDILIENEISLIHYCFFLSPSIPKSKAQSNGLISCSGKSQQVSKKVCTSIGKCCTKKVRLTEDNLFFKTAFTESSSKAKSTFCLI